jgi:hypothetical protein
MSSIKDSMKIKLDKAYEVFNEKEMMNKNFIVDAADGFVIGTFDKKDVGDVVKHFNEVYRKFVFGITGDVFCYEKIKKDDGK